MGCNLSAQFAADRTTAARDQDGLAFDILENLVHIDFNRITTKQVLHRYRFQFAQRNIAVGQLIHTRKTF